MPDCDYCSDSFGEEDEYLTHLKTEHEGELSRIDQKRVDGVQVADDDGFEINVGIAVIIGVFLLTGIAVALTLWPAGGDAADGPQYGEDVHEHGTMDVVIAGEQLDLSGDRQFVRPNEPGFHFHGDEQNLYGEHVWHLHAGDVSLQYALDTLGIEVNDDGTELTYNGTTYDASDPGTDIAITVDGDPVAPAEHLLSGVGPEREAAAGAGDDVRVVVETEG